MASSKKGPKPRHGTDVGPCKRASVSMPRSLWQWCEEEALFSTDQKTASVSAYIVGLLMREKKLQEQRLKQSGKKK